MNPPASATSALSFFPKGKTPRPEQIRSISEIERHFAEGKRFVTLQAPVGSGKSFVASSIAEKGVSDAQRSFVVTIQKALQDQYVDDLPPPLVESLKGRTNYPCSYKGDEHRDASRGFCRRIRKKGLITECLKYGTVEQATSMELPPDAIRCDYWRQIKKTYDNPISLFNFHSFLYQQRLDRFTKRDLLILDEAHQAENVLLQFIEISFSDKVLRAIGVRLDLSLKTGEAVVAWIRKEGVAKKIKDALGDAAESEDAAENLTPAETDQLKALLEKVANLERYLELTRWIVDVTEIPSEDDPLDRTRKLRVRPLFISLFAKEILFSNAAKTLAMSATILDPKIWSRNLGVSMAELGYIDVPSNFPVKNRPIYLDYAGSMAFRDLDATLPKLYRKITDLMERHAGERGIIHAHSEQLVRKIVENVRSPRFVYLDQFLKRDKTALLAAHAERFDSVIVASGMHEGIDLADDMGRFQLIAKIPWPGMNDAFVKARMEADGSFLPYQTALKLCQSVGRCVRHDSDHAETVILDSGFDGFMKRSSYLLPKWFSEAVVRKSTTG